MTEEKLKKILERHQSWLDDERGGERADLRSADLNGANFSGADLRGADLNGADLSYADLNGANLSGADLRGADLNGAYLSCAYLSSANLSGADLRGADLYGADLSYANLRGANLSCANLNGANLRGADLRGVDLNGAYLSCAYLSSANFSGADLSGAVGNAITSFFYPQCPQEGSFIAYKKARGLIVVLEIPADAKRSSATTLKCRADKAKVLRLEELDGTISKFTSVCSDYDPNFIYTVGEKVEVKDFDEDRWNECSRGIHFFISRDCAVAYK